MTHPDSLRKRLLMEAALLCTTKGRTDQSSDVMLLREAAAALTSREAGEGECAKCGAPTDPDCGHVGDCTAPPPGEGERRLRHSCETDMLSDCPACKADLADDATPAPPPPVGGKAWDSLALIERNMRDHATSIRPDVPFNEHLLALAIEGWANRIRDYLAAAPATPAATAVGDSAAWGEHGPLVSEDWLLPCDVRVYPATLIRRGCKLSTLMTALKSRADNPDPFPNADLDSLRGVIESIQAELPTEFSAAMASDPKAFLDLAPTPADAGAVDGLLREARELAVSHLGLLFVGDMSDGVEQTKALIARMDAALSAQPEARQGEVGHG